LKGVFNMVRAGTALPASKYLNKLQCQHHKCENENENCQPNKIALDLEIGRRLFFGFCRKQPEKPCELGKRHGCRIVSRTTLYRVFLHANDRCLDFRIDLRSVRHDCYLAMQMFLGSVKNFAFAKATARQAPRFAIAYFAIQMFLASVKKFSASVPPSRPTPLCFIPPKATRSS